MTPFLKKRYVKEHEKASLSIFANRADQPLVAPAAVSISSGFFLEMGLFARLAQATYLLDQVLQILRRHDSDESEWNLLVFEDETSQLRRALLAFLATTELEAEIKEIPFCSPSAICYS